jgi:hypothetical protein
MSCSFLADWPVLKITWSIRDQETDPGKSVAQAAPHQAWPAQAVPLRSLSHFTLALAGELFHQMRVHADHHLGASVARCVSDCQERYGACLSEGIARRCMWWGIFKAATPGLSSTFVRNAFPRWRTRSAGLGPPKIVLINPAG